MLGVALVGNPGILFTMESRRGKFDQIISRRKITKVYKRNDIQIEDIKKLFPASANDKKAIDFLWRISQTEQESEERLSFTSGRAKTTTALTKD